jgi:hypothetical protein
MWYVLLPAGKRMSGTTRSATWAGLFSFFCFCLFRYIAHYFASTDMLAYLWTIHRPTSILLCPPPSTSIHLRPPPSASVRLCPPPRRPPQLRYLSSVHFRYVHLSSVHLSSVHLHLPRSTSVHLCVHLCPPPSTSVLLHLWSTSFPNVYVFEF